MTAAHPGEVAALIARRRLSTKPTAAERAARTLLKQKRIGANAISQEELAARLGLAKSGRWTVGRWERGLSYPEGDAPERLAREIGGRPSDYVKPTGAGQAVVAPSLTRREYNRLLRVAAGFDGLAEEVTALADRVDALEVELQGRKPA